LPWLAIQVRVEMARTHLLPAITTSPAPCSASSMRSSTTTDVGTLRVRVDGLREQTIASRTTRSDTPGPEAAPVPLLPTHLSFIEIAEIQVLSPNTVKTQAISIYRKLGASSRSDAVARARELGLLDS
jgi:LuxR family maltose regulon positive regulatory protein